MIQEQPFPFWMSDKPITYTELQKLCAAKYYREGPTLIDRCRHNLERYAHVSDRREAMEVMLALEEDSLELSCQNAVWTDFSVAIFEVLVIPSKQCTSCRTAQYLERVFHSTLRRAKYGDTIGESRG